MITTHEKLLAPVLKLAAQRGELALIPTIQQMVATYPLPRFRSLVGARDLAEPASRLVTLAVNYLAYAGLMEPTKPLAWRITTAGRELADRLVADLTLADLKRYPAYNEHWASVARDQLRDKFQYLRFEHYASGRLLLLNGSITAALMLLAYTIEYHLKAALVEVEQRWTAEERKLVHGKHSLTRLYRACQDHKLLLQTYIQGDFFDYANDHFKRRYPSLEAEVMAERSYWSVATDILHTYDDCITQLDRGLAAHYGTDKFMLGTRALAGGFGTAESLVKALFHANVHLLQDLPRHLAAAKESRLFPPDEEPNARPEVWYCDEGLPDPGVSLARARELLDWNLAAYFRYQKQREPNPDPARLLFERDLSPTLTDFKWIVDQAAAAFGRGAVELERDRDRGVILTVFKREAHYWFRQAVLSAGHLHFAAVHRDSTGKAAVERWLAETCEMFRSERRNLRKPPKPRKPAASTAAQ